ncbi:uncharacterized protein SPAPADRAFT_63290 [Spathaspora passalidarum NRRL Y-27907]|uniref:Small ribosomal subunit protein mS29 n=1 Tax=Spathaspora passalidarum (strain NRRL Y-27907 / 11-Y1) TaxID=619300 RepID=G3AU81_SPAPN|nr:uncharacterized protein SPAPADRAFT_63290 [Spathaspora passalidarum NRRL Y-27907]EGW30457.1 hypothetical protein SPAPADRAFT_63290 [Spathaspora passalidarum NRRL Y-27907]
MLRATNRLVVSSKATIGLRAISTTPALLAPKAKLTGPKKAQGTKKWSASNQPAKPKKSGMTHHKFRDAVYNLNWDKYASELPPIPNLNVKNLKANSHMARYSPSVEAALSKFGGFKKGQYHELFEHPVTLANENTQRLNQEFISKLEGNSKDNRVYITGDQAIGKSTLVTQTLGLALEKFGQDKTLILHFDTPKVITNGTSDYIFNKDLGLYQQPMLTKRWVYKFRQVNEATLKTLKLTEDVKFSVKGKPVALKAGTNTLYEYLVQCHDFGSSTPTQGFQFFINQLKAHSKTVPVVVTVDDFNTLAEFPVTEYKHPDFTSIHATQFEMADFLFKCASGELNFAQGGVLLANTTAVSQHRETMEVALDQTKYDPFANKKYFDREIAEKLLQNGGVKEFKMTPLTKDDTRQLMAFWKDTGILQIRPDFTKKDYNKEEAFSMSISKQFENLVNLQYVSTQGVPGYLLRKSVMHY